MINLAVYNKDGGQVETLKVDENVFGGYVHYPLLKQALVMYNANKRLGTASTKNRSRVEGSTRKLYRQKGTGNARVGNLRTAKRVGGGVTFEKLPRSFRQRMPKKQRLLAANCAVLYKLLNDSVVILDELKIEKPKTSEVVHILSNLKIGRSCLIMIGQSNPNVYKSVRNIPRVSVMSVDQLNASDVCNHNKLLFTKDAFMSLLNKDKASVS